MSSVLSSSSLDSSSSEFSTSSTSPDSSPESIHYSPPLPAMADISKCIQISESGSLPLTPASVAGINKTVIRPITITPRHRTVPKLKLRDRSISPVLKNPKMPEVPSFLVPMNRTPRNLVPESWTKYDNTPRVKSSSSARDALRSHSLPTNVDSNTQSVTTTTYTTVLVHRPNHKNNPREIPEITQDDLEQLSARLRRNSENYSLNERLNKSAIRLLYEKIHYICLKIWRCVSGFFTCWRR